MKKPRVVVLGEFQTGKSTLVCCLLGHRAARLGEGLPTTLFPVLYRFDQADFVIGLPREGRPFEVTLENFTAGQPEERWRDTELGIVSMYNPLLQAVEVEDTPGFGQDQNLEDVVLNAAGDADFLLLVMTKGFPSSRESFTSFVRSALAGRRYGLILNCGRECPADPRSHACVRIENDLRAGLQRLGLGPPALSHRVNLGRLYREAIASSAERPRRSALAVRVFKECGFDGLRESLVQEARKPAAAHTHP